MPLIIRFLRLPHVEHVSFSYTAGVVFGRAIPDWRCPLDPLLFRDPAAPRVVARRNTSFDRFLVPPWLLELDQIVSQGHPEHTRIRS